MSDDDAATHHKIIHARSGPTLEIVRPPRRGGRLRVGLAAQPSVQVQNELETHGEAAFPGKGGRAYSTDEFIRLRRENARLREERDIQEGIPHQHRRPHFYGSLGWMITCGGTDAGV